MNNIEKPNFYEEASKKTERKTIHPSLTPPHLVLLTAFVLGVANIACRVAEIQKNPDVEPITPTATPTLMVEPTPIATVPPDQSLFGPPDKNGDNVINIVDLKIQLKNAGRECDECADVNGDGTVTQKDADLLQFTIDNPGDSGLGVRADANGDSVVNGDDVKWVEARVGSEIPGGGVFKDHPWGYKADTITIKIKPGTSQEEIARLEDQFNLTGLTVFQLNEIQTAIRSEEDIRNQSIDELIAKLTAEGSVENVSKIFLGTTQ